MNLIQSIVSRYGGWLASDKRSGAIPAPGHSARDRSVSLRLNSENKLLIHCFSDTDWRDVKALLLRDDAAHEDDFVGSRSSGGCSVRRMVKPRAVSSAPRPSTSHALAAWADRSQIQGTQAQQYLKLRGLGHLAEADTLGFHAAWPMSQTPGARRAPCLLAKITDRSGKLQGVQATFLFQTRRGLRKRRLVYGRQMGFAIELGAHGSSLLVGEGLESTASAAHRFQTPAWSLLNTANMAVFRAPVGVRRLIIAHDNDKGGRLAGEACAALNEQHGIECDLQPPSEPGADWNDADRLAGAP